MEEEKEPVDSGKEGQREREREKEKDDKQELEDKINAKNKTGRRLGKMGGRKA